MVLYKRKPILPEAPWMEYADDAEVWVFEATGEVFTDYQAYLERLEYYCQRKFTCEITGKTNLKFFEALSSEREESAAVENNFPESLREPILRRAQFSTISRIDDLVSSLYEEFKTEYYPGEKLTVAVDESGEKLEGVLKDKVTFPAIPGREKFTRYCIAPINNVNQEIVADDKHVFRARGVLTKQTLRSFLKQSLTRERWEGAPWTVKPNLAEYYRIETTVPAWLQQACITAERRAKASVKRGKVDEDSLSFFAEAGDIVSFFEALKVHKGNTKQKDNLYSHYYPILQANAPAFQTKPGNTPSEALPFEHYLHQYPIHPKKGHSELPPPPVVKYPIEDLQIHPQTDNAPRPTLKYLFSGSQGDNADVRPETVGMLLEAWTALNVHAEYFILDTFTFDDFVDAMTFSSEEVDCELFIEIHCAILKTLVDEKGTIDSVIPNAAHLGQDSSESEEESTTSTPAPEAQTNGAKDANSTPSTRSSTMKISNQPNGISIANRVVELLREYGWVDRLKSRDFQHGGWQTIMLGVIHHLAIALPSMRRHEEILRHLAPLDKPATQATVCEQYQTLGLNLRASALGTVVMLAMATKAIKDSMEERQNQMTIDRKEKVEAQRARKPLLEELGKLDDERKILAPDPVPEEDPETIEVLANGEAEDKHPTVDEDVPMIEDSELTEDDIPHQGKSRRASGRATVLKRKREEEEAREQREKKAREKAKLTPYEKVLLKIEEVKEQIKALEDEIAIVDEKLRVNQCHRTKLLGRDRFLNRYWWFERNGQHFEGNEDSSTADYGYANGRLWVQGPDDIARAGFIDLEGDELRDYQRRYNTDVHGRRKTEEGETVLETAANWGFYDSFDELDQLMAWLDERGNREKALLKELHLWKDRIAEFMEVCKQHLTDIAERKANDEEPVRGIATRKKTYVDINTTKYPCLAWTNTAAKSSIRQLHSDGPLRSARRAAKLKEATAILKSKPTTRQGTRYANR